jgi:hypothetical protein
VADRARLLGLEALPPRYFALPMQRRVGRLMGSWRPRWMATLFVVVLRKP